MNGVWKLAVVAFLFLLTGVAVASGQSRPGLGTSQVDQQQEKLCLTCHSPRFPPNDTSHDHWVYGYDPHAYGSPCTVCHGESGPTGGVVGMGWADQYNVGNEQHPTVDESAAMGKSELDCNDLPLPSQNTGGIAGGKHHCFNSTLWADCDNLGVHGGCWLKSDYECLCGWCLALW